MSAALQSQEAVLQVFLLTEIPLHIVSDLIAAESRNSEPEKNNDPRANSQDNSTVGEFRTVKLDKRGSSFAGDWIATYAHASPPEALLFQPAADMTDAPPLAGFCMSVVMFIFLLPRSSIGEDGAGVRSIPGRGFLPNL